MAGCLKRNWVILVIIIFAFLLRVPFLGKFPVGFTPDEASFGYDAFCLLKTGKDQWGHTLPLVLESFGDFKAPLYSYILIPFVALFGLSRPVVRLPNALLGTAAVYVTYLLVRQALKINEKKNLALNVEYSALIASSLLAISPWHIMMNRGAFEANLTTFFLPLGVLLFLRSFKKPNLIIWSSFTFGLNLFTYHSAKLVTPLFVLFLLLLFKKELLNINRKYLYPAIFIFVISLTLTFYTFTQGAGKRAQDVSVFKGALEAQAEARLNAIENGMNSNLARVFHNKYQVAFLRFWNNYKQYFSYKFLFKNGPGEATYGMIPGRGVLYLFELPALVCFVFAFVKNKRSKPLLLILFWLVIAPIPAALTMGVGYAANRASVIIPAFQIASAFGLLWFYGFIRKMFLKRIIKVLCLGFVFVVVASLFSFFKEYFVFSPLRAAKSMLFGNLEVAYWLSNSSKKIIVSTTLSEPHIYIAFANSWNPKDYQSQSRYWSGYKDEGLSFLDQLSSYSLGNYLFKRIGKKELYENTDFLLVGRPDEFPKETLPLKVFKFPDATEAIYVVNPQNENFAFN